MPDHRLDRQLDRLAVDQDRQPGQLAERAGFSARNAPYRMRNVATTKNVNVCRLQPQRRPEDVGDAERLEPERVDVVGERRAAAEDEDGERRRG